MSEQSLTVTEDILEEFGIESAKDKADFMQAFHYTLLLSSGKTVTEAAAEAAINRRNLYTTRWKDLINKAGIIIRARTTQDITAVASYVHEKWAEIIRGQVQVATGPDMRLRTEAAKFLWEAYIQPFEGQTQNDSGEMKYLKEKPNFNPARDLLKMLEEGGELTITAKAPPLTIQSE